jgi:hypothetical protein
MDEQIKERVATLLNAWKQEQLKHHLEEKARHPSVNELVQQLVAKTRAGAELFEKFYDHISTCKLVVGKPKVNKINFSRTWNFRVEKDRLYIVPTVTAASQVGEVVIENLESFLRFYPHTSAGAPPISQMPDGPLPALTSDHWRGRPSWNHFGFFCHDEVLTQLAHKLLGNRLDELNRELQAILADVASKADQILAEHRQKVSGRESRKFQDKLYKFLKLSPGLMNADPDFVIRCFHMNLDDLGALQKFLRSHKADVNFITAQDVLEAQVLARVRDIQES